MRLDQAVEAFTLFTTVRPVREMNTEDAPSVAKDGPGCLLCEGVRSNLYSIKEGDKLSLGKGFSEHFGCTIAEANRLIFHSHMHSGDITTGENYYLAGKELLTKYGYGDLFIEISIDTDSPGIEGEGYLAVKPFSEIMAELKRESVTG